MAVPKNKRYKQVVRSRRFYQKNKLIIKKGLTLSRFKNYLSVSTIIHFFNKKINNKTLFLTNSLKNNINLNKHCTNLFFQQNKWYSYLRLYNFELIVKVCKELLKIKINKI